MAGHVTEADAGFHWQSFFQDAADPLFLLSRRRRILFVNRAWEALTGWSGAQVRGLLCARGGSARADQLESLARALCPPPGVLQGKTVRTRRPAPTHGIPPRFWDLTFSPLQGPDEIIGILGRAQAVTQEELPGGSHAEKLVAIRERTVQRHRFDLLPQTTPAERRLAEQARLASRCGVGVLLVGEKGSGKHWLARTIHFEGPLRNCAFVSLDCLRLPAAAIADFTFGEDGVLRRAAAGTLYLRNLPALQRDLQERFAVFFRASAGNGPRVIGSCGADPAIEVRTGRLLEELYSQFGTLTLVVPPLRDRRSSLRELADRLLDRRGINSEGLHPGFSADAWDLLEAHTWPDNLRELHAVLTTAARRAAGGIIDASHLPASLRQAIRLKHTPGPEETLPRPLDELLEEVERRLIVLSLQRFQGNKTQAAKWLGIWRPRLLRRIESLGIQE